MLAVEALAAGDVGAVELLAAGDADADEAAVVVDDADAVSYTHLTLPTIYSV